MLVAYSSSSEEDSSEAGCEKAAADGHGDGSPERKRPKTDEHPQKTRLPLPGCLLAMFPDDVDPQTEDSSLHSGRIRTFKHERGIWASYVYFPYHPEEEFAELLDQLISVAGTHGVVLTPQEDFHLSLSQTVVLRHHWILPFTRSLRTSLAHCKRFVCSAERLNVYCNAEKTRTFLGMEVSAGHAQLLDLVKVVDRTMTEFSLDTFYKDPSFHVSLAWCVGDQTVQLKEGLLELQSLVDNHDEGPFVLRLECAELRCKTGNKTFHFTLET
ncbi:U6 snRNA phosphodiesterase 1 [Pholidichthys leucotaenia]